MGDRDFYPRPPGGGRPLHGLAAEAKGKFLSTPSGWRATSPRACRRSKRQISIHALRVEGDDGGFSATLNLEYFYPRHPDRGRQSFRMVRSCLCIFLSTSSGRRATEAFANPAHFCSISIHALRVEGDLYKLRQIGVDVEFLSTPSGWRATRPRQLLRPEAKNFYPRPPGGGRRKQRGRRQDCSRFLSTPSGWRAT